MRSIFYLLILFSLSACTSESVESNSTTPNSTTLILEASTSNLAIPDNRFANTYQVLIFGNSHVSGLDDLIDKLISAGNPLAEVKTLNAAGGFLDDSFNYNSRIALLEDKPWTHVILQGQKYSQSGTHIYSTDFAKMWIEKAKKHEITPILFPEHPQQGSKDEGQRIHLIHTAIADEKQSCVAPIGLAWDRVISTAPQLILHRKDGNHASLLGKLLTAYIFYEIITGESADLLPFIESINVEATTQHFLKQFASETIQANQPCKFDS